MEHLELTGAPGEMGRQHGRQLADRIEEVLRHYRSRPAETLPAVRRAAYETEATLLARCPNLVEELRGVAEGAGLPYEEILLLNVQYDSPPPREARCTAIGLPNTPEGALVAKTDDVGLAERPFETRVLAHPDAGYSFLCYAFAGMVANQGGINAAGLAVVMTGLPNPGLYRPDGIPSLLFLRQLLLRCASAAEALSFTETHPLRGYGCSMTLADARSGDITVVENYPTAWAVRRSSHEPTVRTNHPQCPETLALWAGRPPTPPDRPELLPNSQARAQRAQQLAAAIPRSTAGLQRLLGDHSEPGAVCQHGQAGLHTSVAMILIPQRRAALVAEGYGCEPYATYTLA